MGAAGVLVVKLAVKVVVKLVVVKRLAGDHTAELATRMIFGHTILYTSNACRVLLALLVCKYTRHALLVYNIVWLCRACNSCTEPILYKCISTHALLVHTDADDLWELQVYSACSLYWFISTNTGT